jgi:uncharacterized membrane protein
MGSFSIWHWVILLLFVALPIAVIAGIVWLIARAAKRAKPSSSSESRLWELTNLKSKGLISDAEYEQQRAAILRKV